MALAFGGGVRPELGRTDYTPFLQGSVAGAQMQARGAEHMGAALANLGQTAAQAIGQYQERKQEKELFNNFSERLGKILEENPAFGQQIGITDPSDKGAIKAAVKALGGGKIPEGVQAAEMLVQGAMQEQAQRTRIAAGLAEFIRSGDPASAVTAGADVNQIATASSVIEQQRKGIQDQEKFAAANLASEIALKSLSDGKSIDEALDASREYANVDPRVVLDLYREYNALKPKDAANLQIEPREVVLDDGSKINFAAVWTGSQWQIIRPPEAAGDTAEIRNIRTRIDNFEKAQKLYRDGDRSGALNILRAMGEVLFRGSTITQRDLDEYFGPPDEEQDGSPRTTAQPTVSLSPAALKYTR